MSIHGTASAFTGVLLTMIPFEFVGCPDIAPLPSDAAVRRISVISSDALLAHGKLIHIQHRGELYSLRETRLGKLILTK